MPTPPLAKTDLLARASHVRARHTSDAIDTYVQVRLNTHTTDIETVILLIHLTMRRPNIMFSHCRVPISITYARKHDQDKAAPSHPYSPRTRYGSPNPKVPNPRNIRNIPIGAIFGPHWCHIWLGAISPHRRTQSGIPMLREIQRQGLLGPEKIHIQGLLDWGLWYQEHIHWNERKKDLMLI